MATRKKSSVFDPFTSAIEGVAGPSNSSSNPLVKGSYYPLTTDGKEPNFWNTHSESNPGNQYWMQLLSALGQRFGIGQSDLVDFLSSIGLPTGHDISDAQLTDLNKQFVDSLLSAASEQDARNYNQERLAEQRLYDNPQNQLSRLMGAGISRDAAIQMLSGAGGSGAGGVVTGQAASMSSGISATQSDLNDIQRKTAISDTAFNALGAVCGLVSLGVSIPQSIAQTQMLKMQNFLTSEQLAAYKSAGTAYQILNTAGVAAESFGSVSAAASAISQLAKDGNSDAASFIASGGIDAMRKNAPFASRTLVDLYKSERSSSDYDRQFRVFTENQEADTELKKVNADLITKQVENFIDQLENLRADTLYKRDCAALQRAHAILLGKQGKLVQQQTLSLQLANNLEQNFQNSVDGNGNSGVDLYTDLRMQELISSVNRLSKLNDDKAWEKEANVLLSSYDNMLAVYELGTLYERGEIQFIQNADQDTKDLVYFCRAAEKTGLFDYVHTMVDSETAGNFHLGSYSGSQPAENAMNILTDHAPRKKPWYRRIFTRQPKNHD